MNVAIKTGSGIPYNWLKPLVLQNTCWKNSYGKHGDNIGMRI